MPQSSRWFFIVCSLLLFIKWLLTVHSLRFVVILTTVSLVSCRFLRQRYNYLLKHPILKPQPKQQVVKPQKLKIQAPIISKGKNYNKKEPNLRPHHPASHLNSNGRISNVADVPLKKTGHLFDLNLNARSSSKKDASINISGPPVLNLNHKERINSSKEATKKSVTPFFDLNQISVINYTYICVMNPCLCF